MTIVCLSLERPEFTYTELVEGLCIMAFEVVS